MNAQEIIDYLKSQANPQNVAGMARYGISSKNTLGISIPVLRKIAKEAGKDHRLAASLWKSGIHEARLLACFVDDPGRVTPSQMDRWANAFDSWDVCDQCCANLFDRTPYAYEKAAEWSAADKEFVKRAGFALMAALAVHDKQAPNKKFERFLRLIKKQATDERNFVRKAVNWALRQIGKRNRELNQKAVELAREMRMSDSKPARWIASDALRELESDKVREKLNR